MKSTLLSLFLLCFFCLSAAAQGNSFTNRVLAKIQDDGTVKWHVTEAQINEYLTSVLNIDLEIRGEITTSTIMYLTDLGYWVIQGQGTEDNDPGLSRQIRVELEIVGNGNLQVKAQGLTTSCVGTRCSTCKVHVTLCGCDVPSGENASCTSKTARTK